MVCCGMYGMVGFGCDVRCDGADGLAGLSFDMRCWRLCRVGARDHGALGAAVRDGAGCCDCGGCSDRALAWLLAHQSVSIQRRARAD